LRRGPRVRGAVDGGLGGGQRVDDGAGLGERFGVEVGDQPAAGAAEVAPEPQPAPLIRAGLGGGPVVIGPGRVERLGEPAPDPGQLLGVQGRGAGDQRRLGLGDLRGGHGVG
jgi:hypothetical protein